MVGRGSDDGASGAGQPAAGLGLPALLALVAGAMVGAGIFSLPQSFASAGGPLAALLAWGLAGGGMLTFALVLRDLARRQPGLDCSMHAYARAGFGNYAGFLSAFGYWVSICVGNAGYFVLIRVALAGVLPDDPGWTPGLSVAIASGLLWAVHALVLRGVRPAAMVTMVVTIAKLAAIASLLLVLLRHFDRAVFSANLRAGIDGSAGPLLAQLRPAMLVTVFAFLGVEAASVLSRHARRRRDIGTATLGGGLGVLVLLLLVTLLPYGLQPRVELASLPGPALASLLAQTLGPAGAIAAAATLGVAVLGAALAWTLLAAETLWSAGQAGTMPKFLAVRNERQMPAQALRLTSVTVQFLLLLSLLGGNAFGLALKLTSAMSLLAYLCCAAYALRLALRGEPSPRHPWAGRVRAALLPGAATVTTLVLLWGGGLELLVLSALVYVPGSLLFLLARLERDDDMFTLCEILVFLLAVLAAIAAAVALARGAIAI